MKKLSKIIVLIIMLTLVACVSTRVLAADDPIDLSNSLTGGNSTTGNTTTGNETTGNATTGNETTGNTTTGNETTGNTTTGNETTGNTTTGNSATDGNTNGNEVKDITPSNTTNNTSTYQESSIPHAGVESSVLMVVAFVVCAIIGIYTFMKLSDYSNI